MAASPTYRRLRAAVEDLIRMKQAPRPHDDHHVFATAQEVERLVRALADEGVPKHHRDYREKVRFWAPRPRTWSDKWLPTMLFWVGGSTMILFASSILLASLTAKSPVVAPVSVPEQAAPVVSAVDASTNITEATEVWGHREAHGTAHPAAGSRERRAPCGKFSVTAARLAAEAAEAEVRACVEALEAARRRQLEAHAEWVVAVRKGHAEVMRGVR